MKINGEEIDINRIKEEEKKNFYKRTKNGIMLNDEQREILALHHIDYESCHTLQELLFKIEECLNEENIDYENIDLENISLELSEMYYYNYINK